MENLHSPKLPKRDTHENAVLGVAFVFALWILIAAMVALSI